MTHYAGSADPIARELPSTWPSDSLLQHSSDQPTLVLFIHPRCPCTVATIHELERVLTGFGIQERQLPKLHVLVTVPVDHSLQSLSNQKSNDWTKTSSIDAASKLPNAEIHWDIGGVEAARFNARASGTVMFYDTNGLLRFSGGVTIARGHQGTSVGGDNLQQLLQNPRSMVVQSTPVFGCALVRSSTSFQSIASPVVNKIETSPVDPEGNEQ